MDEIAQSRSMHACKRAPHQKGRPRDVTLISDDDGGGADVPGGSDRCRGAHLDHHRHNSFDRHGSAGIPAACDNGGTDASALSLQTQLPPRC